MSKGAGQVRLDLRRSYCSIEVILTLTEVFSSPSFKVVTKNRNICYQFVPSSFKNNTLLLFPVCIHYC